jgi:hypothetical protein
MTILRSNLEQKKTLNLEFNMGATISESIIVSQDTFISSKQ